MKILVCFGLLLGIVLAIGSLNSQAVNCSNDGYIDYGDEDMSLEPGLLYWTTGQGVEESGEMLLIVRPGPVITDSVVWKTIGVDNLNLGKEDCEHEWVYSETWRAGGAIQCCVLHYGSHCSWDDQMRERICKKCLRKETQREQWYQHEERAIETEFEQLEKKLNKENQ